MTDEGTRETISGWARRLGVRLTALGFEGFADGALPPSEPFRAGPRRGDLLIVAGTVSEKTAPLLRRLWDELPEPKWAIALGPGGPFRTYAVAREIGRVIPLDVHLPGWPPKPEDLLAALQELERKIAPGAPA
jgi:NADH-quinone oxidoreductase subunit B